MLYVLIFLSGGGALLYELLWFRLYTVQLGITLNATTTVLGAFMGGVALGSFAMGRNINRLRSPLLAFGVLELLLGAYSFFLPRMLHGSGTVMAGLLLVPASALIGATFPALLQHLMHRHPDDVGVPSRLYTADLMGAVAGTMLTGFYLLPSLGVSQTNQLAAIASLTVGVLALLVARFERPLPSRAQPTRVETSNVRGRGWVLGVAALSGAAALTCQIVWMRVLGVIVQNTIFSATCVLAVFLLGLAVGALVLAPRLIQKGSHTTSLGALQMGIALCALVSPFIFRALDTHLGAQFDLQHLHGASWATLALIKPMGVAALALLLPTTLMGAGLPLSFHMYSSDFKKLAGGVGMVTASNTAGAILSAIVTGFLLIPVWGSPMALLAAGVFSLTAAHFCLKRHLSPQSRWLRRWGTALTLLLAVIVSRDDAGIFFTRLLGQEVALRKEDAFGLVEVLRSGNEQRLLINRNHLWGTTDEWGVRTMRRQGYFPLLLHPRPRSVIEVGLATGTNFAPVVHYGAVEKAEMVELSPAIVEAARLFAAQNANLLSHPKVRTVIDDGRSYLSSIQNKYDVIILGLFTPYVPSASYLYGRELYEVTRERLAPGGLVVQWVPVHEMTLEGIRTVVATFGSAFPQMQIWENTSYIALVGSHEPLRIDFKQLEQSFRDASIRDDLKQNEIDDPHVFLSSFLMGNEQARAFSSGAPLNTVDRPVLEFNHLKIPLTRGPEYTTENFLALLAHRQPPTEILKNIDASAQQTVTRAYEARGRSLFGVIASRRGDAKQARQNFTEALDLYPTEEIARLELGVTGK